ncbi:hypothetical protein VPH35_066916 [Triticum aestivum]
MTKEPSAKHHHGETFDKSSNLVDVHVPGEKRDPKHLNDVLQHEKLFTLFGFGIEADKEKLKMSGLEINPNKYIDIQRIWRVSYIGKEYDSLTDVAASAIHPFYKGMKKNIDVQEDHKLWGISPLPDNLMEYARVMSTPSTSHGT